MIGAVLATACSDSSNKSEIMFPPLLNHKSTHQLQGPVKKVSVKTKTRYSSEVLSHRESVYDQSGYKTSDIITYYDDGEAVSKIKTSYHYDSMHRLVKAESNGAIAYSFMRYDTDLVVVRCYRQPKETEKDNNGLISLYQLSSIEVSSCASFSKYYYEDDTILYPNKVTYALGDTLRQTTSFQYDPEKKIIVLEEAMLNTDIKRRTLRKYNKNNLLIKEHTPKTDNKLEQVSMFKYDKDRLLVEAIHWLDSLVKPSAKESIQYQEFDRYGNWTKSFNSVNTDTFEETRTLEYYLK